MLPNKQFLMAAYLCLGTIVAVAQSPATSSSKLRYNFTQGQRISVEWEEVSDDTEEELLESTRSATHETKKNSIDLEVLAVTAGGEATVAIKYKSLSFTRSLPGGFSLAFDTQKKIADSNPMLVQLGEQTKSTLDKLENFRQVMSTAFIGAPIRLAVNNQGAVTSVTGMKVIWDKYREAAAKIISDPSKRAELDSLIEGFFGERAISKLFSFSLFIPYPAEDIKQGQAWTDKTEFGMGVIRLLVKRDYKLTSDPVAGGPLQISGTMEFGAPTSTAGVEFTVPKSIIQDNVTVDAKTGLPIRRQYQGRVEMEAYIPQGQGRKLLSRFSSDLKGTVTMTSTK